MSSKSHIPTLATQLRPWPGSAECLGGSLWAQGGIGRGDEGDGDFGIFLEMVLEMSLPFLFFFWKKHNAVGVLSLEILRFVCRPGLFMSYLTLARFPSLPPAHCPHL